MSKDINPILEGWEYRPNEVTVRKIRGNDGKIRIQLRLDLGLLQMEAEGRPDGQRPYGYESLLEYYQAIIQEHRIKYGTDENFQLETEDCIKLQQEAVQYYHRYLSLFHLGEYEAVQRDTEHNLRVFNLVKKYAKEEKDVWVFEQYRPYVIMMNTRARASISLNRKDYQLTLRHIANGIKDIRRFFKEYGQPELADSCAEVRFLQNWAEEIRQNRPLSPVERLRKQLNEAIAREEYEKAAVLRDQLKMLRGF